MSDWEYPEEYFNEDRVKNDEILQFGIINRSPEIRGLWLSKSEKFEKWLKNPVLVSLNETKQTGKDVEKKEIKLSRFRRSRSNNPLPEEDQEAAEKNNIVKENSTSPEEKSFTMWSNAKKILIGAGIVYGIVQCREIPAKIYAKIFK